MIKTLWPETIIEELVYNAQPTEAKAGQQPLSPAESKKSVKEPTGGCGSCLWALMGGKGGTVGQEPTAGVPTNPSKIRSNNDRKASVVSKHLPSHMSLGSRYVSVR